VVLINTKQTVRTRGKDCIGFESTGRATALDQTRSCLTNVVPPARTWERIRINGHAFNHSHTEIAVGLNRLIMIPFSSSLTHSLCVFFSVLFVRLRGKVKRQNSLLTVNASQVKDQK